MNEVLIKEKTQLLLESNCCPELRKAAEGFLAAEGTNEYASAKKQYMLELENGIVTVDELLELFNSPQAKAHFGEEKASELYNQFSQQKAAGISRCGCDACNTAAEILDLMNS